MGAHATIQGASAYETTKLAVTRFTEFIMSDYGEQGMLAWSVHPGGVVTELASKLPKHMRNRESCLSYTSFSLGEDGVPNRCPGECSGLTDTPEVGGDTIVYLTQKRQDWLAGRYVSCTWDMPEFFAKKDEVLERDLLKVRMRV